jgi:hypothetical protein
MNVYLVSAEPSTITNLPPALQSFNGRPLHTTAWVVPSHDSVEGLAGCLRSGLVQGARLVVAEIVGGWALI